MLQLTKIILFLIISNTLGCSWHLRNKKIISLQMKKIIFDSEDPNGPLSLAILNQLRLNKILLVEKDSSNQGISSFRVLKSSLRKDTVSIFSNGNTAEHQVVLSVSAILLIPGKDIYPINIKIYQSFFNNPQNLLAKAVEQQIIINDMYNKAAESLILKLSIIQSKLKTIQ